MMQRFDRNTLILTAGDWLALALFVFIGQLEHELITAATLSGLLRTTLLLALPWTVVALLLRAYELSAETTGRTFLGRSLLAWLVAAPLALLLRAYLQGQATIIVIFMTITLTLGGLFLLVWRALYFLLWRRRNSHEAAL